MNTQTTPLLPPVIEAAHYRPAVSVIMPFEPKMKLKKELTRSLEMASDKIEEELENYPGELGMLVMQKLKAVIKNLDFNTYKKSIAIYVSPVFEKVLYLDIDVEENISIDGPFQLRNLVENKKQWRKYLVLLITGKESRIYSGNAHNLVKIVSDTPHAAYGYTQLVPESSPDFSGMREPAETVTDKFLQHIDNSLDIILTAYQLPLFVLAPEKILRHFKGITKHTGEVIEFIQGHFEAATLSDLKEIMGPLVNAWDRVRHKYLMNQVKIAGCKNKLATGMRDVWLEATARKGRLLVVEKNYKYVAEPGNSDEIINKATRPYNAFSYVKDAIDDVMEKVLDNGGDVEFVKEGTLNDYGQIALVQY